MSRGKKRIERKLIPDGKYNSSFVTKFINILMLNGKKEVAEKLFYLASSKFEKELTEKYNLDFNLSFQKFILDISPSVITKTKRVAGSNYQVPIQLQDYQKLFFGMRLLKNISRKKSESSSMMMHEALANEILLALKEQGDVLKERDNMHKMASSNKVYSNLI
jgi:small subunit ribosomal protein S7